MPAPDGEPDMKVAFLGLGAMGMPMAVNIARAGHRLTLWNRNERPLEGFGETKPLRARSIAEAVRDAEAVITMLADDAAVEAVVNGSLLEVLPECAVHVGMSTIGIDTARRLTEAHRQRGRAYVAAPVFGRPDVAKAAKLWVVTAGPADARGRVRPLFEAIGRGVSEFGDEPWHANLVKLGNNFLLAAMLEAVGEACALMRKAGIDPKAFVDAANAIFQSPVYANYGGAVAEGRSEPALFKAVLGLKDLRLALAAADALAVPMPVAGVAHDSLLSAVAHGHGDKDWTVLAETSRQRAGLH
jgi:3-hydroxyisobutyrate dehydrogenase-like beta-hydroxyacid dehydrogenase